jgi:hypothetical protein
MKNKPSHDRVGEAEEVRLSALIIEYTALREEILKRMEFQHQFISLTLIIMATVLSIGLQLKLPVSPLFVYPLVAVFLTLGWKHHNTRVSEIGRYIRNNIESKLEYLNWETYFHSKVDQEQPRLAKQSWRVFSAYGIFVGTQITTFLLALLRSNFTTIEIILSFGNLIVIIVSIRILMR